MSKRELIDAIRQHNRSVAPEFLARFAERDLEAYLERVCIVTSHPPHDRLVTAIATKEKLLIA